MFMYFTKDFHQNKHKMYSSLFHQNPKTYFLCNFLRDKPCPIPLRYDSIELIQEKPIPDGRKIVPEGSPQGSPQGTPRVPRNP